MWYLRDRFSHFSIIIEYIPVYFLNGFWNWNELNSNIKFVKACNKVLKLLPSQSSWQTILSLGEIELSFLIFSLFEFRLVNHSWIILFLRWNEINLQRAHWDIRNSFLILNFKLRTIIIIVIVRWALMWAYRRKIFIEVVKRR